MMHRIFRPTLVLLMCAGLFAAVLAAGQKKDPASALLETAIQKETVDGNWKEAVRLYNEIVAKHGDNRSVAAAALLRLGELHARRTDTTEARKAYARLIDKYPDQKVADTARARLASDAGRAAPSGAARGVPTERNLGNGGGRHIDMGAVRADGRVMAVTDENLDLALWDLASGTVQALGLVKDGKGEASRPVFSRDSKWLAYVWNYQLAVGPAERGGTHRVVNEARGYQLLIPTDWSVDGKSILAFGYKQDGTFAIVSVSVADGQITQLKSIGWRAVGRPGFPRFSPDGRYIAYAAASVDKRGKSEDENRSMSHVYILAADGSTEHGIAQTAGVNESPTWTPDGKHLLFISDRSGTLGLWSVPIENGKAAGEPKELQRNFGRVRMVGTTDAGSYYYVKTVQTHPMISVERVAGPASGTTTGSAPSTIAGVLPSWSPDGNRIAFLRKTGESVFTLIVKSLDTGVERRYDHSLSARTNLTRPGREGERPAPNGGSPLPPIWLHDGSAVLLSMAARANARENLLYRVDLKTGAFKQVFPTTFREVPAAVSVDNQRVYVRRSDEKGNHIVEVNLSDGHQRQIYSESELLGYSFSSDGRWLYVTSCYANSPVSPRRLQQTQEEETIRPSCVKAVDLATGEAKQVLAATAPDWIQGNPVPSADGRVAAVLRSAEGYSVIRAGAEGSYYRAYGPVNALLTVAGWTADRAILFTSGGGRGGTPQPMMRIPASGGVPDAIARIRANAVSPDGSRIAFSESAPNARPSTTELWALDNISSLLKTGR